MMKRNSPGFTLIELSIVLSLFALLSLLVVANISFLQRMVVRCELENLYTTCYLLQKQAMMNGSSVALTFDQQLPGYRYGTIIYTLPHYVLFGVPAGAKGPPGSATTNITTPITFKNQTMVFHPDGIIQSGTVYLTDSSKRWGYAISCAVSQVSYLRKYQYTGTWSMM